MALKILPQDQQRVYVFAEDTVIQRTKLENIFSEWRVGPATQTRRN